MKSRLALLSMVGLASCTTVPSSTGAGGGGAQASSTGSTASASQSSSDTASSSEAGSTTASSGTSTSTSTSASSGTGGCPQVCDDMNPCTSDSCVAGQCEKENLPAGTVCETSNECDGAGVCCVPTGTACNGKQCGDVVDNCNATIQCTSLCSPAQHGCVANICVECDAAPDCAASVKGAACLAVSNVCGCTAASEAVDCAGIVGKPKCVTTGALVGTCQACNVSNDCMPGVPKNEGSLCLANKTCGCAQDLDCTHSRRGDFCGAGTAGKCGCADNGDCSASPGYQGGKTCGAVTPNVCGCTVANQAFDCGGGTCNGATGFCN